MPKTPKLKRIAKSYRFDSETIDLIDGLSRCLVDRDTGEHRTATGVLQLSVRLLAKQYRKQLAALAKS